MKDRRPIDDLSIEEIERVLADKKRAAREARLARYRSTGRAVHMPVGETSVQTSAARPAYAPRSFVRRFFDFFLLVIEVGAVLGLVFVLYNGTAILRQINQESIKLVAPDLPAFTPTPIVSAVVLPSGHTPPDAAGLSQFNWAEIPPSLLPLVQSMPQPVVPTPGPSQARRIVIPAIDVDAKIVQGDCEEQLKQWVAQNLSSPDPGQAGNLILSAHNDIYGEIFRRLDELSPGDEIQIYTASQIFTYIITRTRIVEPTEVSVMGPTAHPSLTLISCYPYMIDKQRIVVFADLKTQ
jgi:sortase A